MFEIKNTRKSGELSFYTVKNRSVVLQPEQTRNFSADDLHPNILRGMIGKNSFFSVKATSERAMQMLADAGKRPDKPSAFPLVHGSGDRSLQEVLANSDKVIPVRDLKTPIEKKGGQSNEQIAATSPAPEPGTEGTGLQKEPQQLAAEGEAQRRFLTDPANPDLPGGGNPPPDAPPEPPPASPPPPEPSRKERAAALLEGIADAPIGELQASARELLGDAFPKGNAGRKAIKDALTQVE